MFLPFLHEQRHPMKQNQRHHIQGTIRTYSSELAEQRSRDTTSERPEFWKKEAECEVRCHREGVPGVPRRFICQSQYRYILIPVVVWVAIRLSVGMMPNYMLHPPVVQWRDQEALYRKLCKRTLNLWELRQDVAMHRFMA